jgi:hypothetical protein
MTPGFQETFLDTRSSDGVNDRLLSPLTYLDFDGELYRAPEWSETDGGSQPKLIGLIPGFEPMGKHWFQYVLHDAGYRGTLMILKGLAGWKFAKLSRSECDRLLERSIARVSPKAVSLAVYAGVRAGGWRYYKKS